MRVTLDSGHGSKPVTTMGWNERDNGSASKGPGTFTGLASGLGIGRGELVHFVAGRLLFCQEGGSGNSYARRPAA